MTEIVKETLITKENSTSTHGDVKVDSIQTIERLIYYIFGIVEILLVFRIIFKLAGASLESSFVGLIYGITGIFVMPFERIFSRSFAQGLETTSVLEPSAMVALIVYVVLSWGTAKLIRILSEK